MDRVKSLSVENRESSPKDCNRSQSQHHSTVMQSLCQSLNGERNSAGALNLMGLCPMPRPRREAGKEGLPFLSRGWSVNRCQGRFAACARRHRTPAPPFHGPLTTLPLLRCPGRAASALCRRCWPCPVPVSLPASSLCMRLRCRGAPSGRGLS